MVPKDDAGGRDAAHAFLVFLQLVGPSLRTLFTDYWPSAIPPHVSFPRLVALSLHQEKADYRKSRLLGTETL
ncbi:hypothetical protein PUNSTDRAFT_55513 [Punctularia strigosozonata HHB-11173 SS5]|uniref:Uncharacterized protein n=1 Tax=Punctularia strigosozonata (strain HHB-11173) TaxID=741275 RepID=R7S2P4_PUNST|nr:uncharacterized protein PUNSTDRAFT_55513 [Punctularia strigosozonata HHB-11173 SS5]EIN04483.1 hypothetical protein PUNSTDRAFT_55513 [Punctularia strigosozonata HHB-11173 SS5]